MRVMLALIGALLLLGGARSVEAAAPCANAVPVTSSLMTRTQAISDTIQPATNLFVCRVDGAGTPTNTSIVGTRRVTSTGLIVLVVARWLHFIGYALGFGTIAFSLWATNALHDDRTQDAGRSAALMRRVWRLVYIGIVLMLGAEPLALLAQTIGVGSIFFDPAIVGDVLASGFGLIWAQRVGVALLLWVVIGVVKDGSVGALWAVPPLGLVLAIIDGIASTAGARLPVVAIAATTLHEAAMGAWLGTLALLLILWTGLARDQRDLLVARVIRLSGAAIGVLSVTGLVMATMHLTQLADLIVTFYGALLTIKLLVALLAMLLAAGGQCIYHTLWRGRAALTTLIVVLGVASLLVSVPSP